MARMLRWAIAGCAAAAFLLLPAGGAEAQTPAAGDTWVLAGHGAADVEVVYRSDPRTCRRGGRCGTSGVVRVRVPARSPAGGADMTMAGRTVGFGGLVSERARTVARVSMPGGRRCRDRLRTPLLSYVLTTHGDRARVTFLAVAASTVVAGAEPLATRCSSPLTVDLARGNALPRTPWFPLARLESGEPFTLRADGRRAFRSGGFRGTVRYRIELNVTATAAPVAPAAR